MERQETSHTYREIKSQGGTWASTLVEARSLSEIGKRWLQKERTEVVFTGCGSTYYLAHAASWLWQALTSTRASSLPASEIWLFPSSTLLDNHRRMVAVSRSGETTETLRAAQLFCESGDRGLFAITCYEDTPLERFADHTLIAQAAGEQSMAQTRSFSSMYLLAQYIAGLAAQRSDFLTELEQIPERFNPVVERAEPIAIALGSDPTIEKIIYLGSGPYYGLACEGMLKMKEMSLSTSEAYHFLEFRHGPKSIVNPDTLIVGLVSDPAREHELKVLQELRELGGRVLALVDEPESLPVESFSLNSGIPWLARGCLYLPMLQLFAYYRAAKKSINPDAPKNLQAVVRL